MRHIITTFLLMGSLMAAPALAAPTPPKAVSTAATEQWEYLVVSYGKAYFSSPVDSETKKSGSKVINYGALGLTLPEEALSLQSNMDILGKYGWELVSVVGSIGGDQQLLFKRQYDPKRSSQEKADILKEAARIKKLEEDLKKDAAKQTQTQKTTPAATATEVTLVELDAAEQEKERQLLEQQQINELKAGLSNIKGFKFKTIDVKSDGVTNSTRSSSIQINLDVSHLASNGTYRISQVRNQITSFVQNFENSFSNKVKPNTYSSSCYFGLSLKITAQITYKSKTFDVASQQKCFDFSN